MDTQNKLLGFCAAIAIALTGPAADSAVKIVTIENGIEASTDTAILPAASGGTVVISCPGCRPRSYRVTDQTAYFVGTDAVSLAQLNTFVQAGGYYLMMVYLKPADSTVTRVVVAAQLPHTTKP